MRMYTGVPGAWNTMKSISNRTDSDVLDMTNEFQRRYLSNKYELNSISHKQGNLFHQKGKIDFHVMSSYGLLKIMDIYDEISRNYAIHDSDIVFLSNRIDILQEIDKILRDRGKHTNRTFESTEEKQKIERKYKLECPNYCKELINKLRRIYKKKFYCGKGTVKLSTIHSFKGWELNTVIMILSPSPVLHENLNDELVYTGITRARVNLIVISIGENDYNDFFAQYIGNVSK